VLGELHLLGQDALQLLQDLLVGRLLLLQLFQLGLAFFRLADLFLELLAALDDGTDLVLGRRVMDEVENAEQGRADHQKNQQLPVPG